MLPLTGGEKDIKPPVLLAQSPKSGQLNFSSDKVIIEFDEYIQLKDIQNQLIITPRLNKSPEITVSGKTLTVQFKEALKQETTYNLNFGSSIADVHEGNALADFSVVFSTGNYLDSLSLSGNVTDAFTRKPEENVSVFLYLEGDDSSCFKRKPDYFAHADKAGYYRIDYLRPGHYKIMAFTDQNKNFIYEPEEERVDEWSDSGNKNIYLSKNERHDFSLYKDQGKKFYIKKQWYDEFGKVRFCFNRPLFKPSITTDKEKELLMMFSTNNDTLTVFYTPNITDSTFILLSEQNSIVDTLLLKKPLKEKMETEKRKGLLKPRISFTRQLINDSAIYVQFSTAVKILHINEVFLKSPIEKINISQTDSLTPTTRKLYFTAPFSEGELIFLPGAIESWSGEKNDSSITKCNFKSAESLGTLNLSIVKNSTYMHILQLLNESDQTIYECKVATKNSAAEKIKITKIPTGNFKLRLIADENEDGKWTSGNLIQRKKPEQVFYYGKPIEILADWEVNLEWKIEN